MLFSADRPLAIVFNKCWQPIEKNAYGDKVKNFKEIKKLENIDDFIVKINTDSNSIIIKNYLLKMEKKQMTIILKSPL